MKNYKIVFPEGYVKPKLPHLKKWTKALRSGDYKQGKASLCRNDHYCCLGVYAEECFGEKKPKGGLFPVNFIPNFVFGRFPNRVKVINIEKDVAISLAGLNDSFSFDFSTIADIIEEIWDEE